MKKLFTFFLCVAILLPLLFTACQKEQEGVYNPKKKIERIYTEMHAIDYDYNDQYNIGKHISEVWNWDGDRLNSITLYDEEGSYETTVTFSYDGERISGMSYDGQDYRYAFNYENNLIVSIIAYRRNNVRGIWRFTHTDDKITRIDSEDIFDKNDTKDSHTPTISPLRFILPSLDLEKATNTCRMTQKEKGSSSTGVWELEWDKKNIQKVKYTSGWYDEADNYFPYNYLLEFTYDTRVNPFYNSYRGDANYTIYSENVLQYYYPVATSKNNVLTRKYSGSETLEMTLEYNYTYEDQFPIVQEMNVVSYTTQGVQENWTLREVVYYEYE